jgi:hypothetical protein
MKTLKSIIVLSLITIVVTTITASTQQSEERRPQRERWNQVSMWARVVAIDWKNREVLLQGLEGNLVTVEADESVERFNEISIGDYVNAEFWTYMKAEFRNPTPEEIQEPLVILAEAGKASRDMPPGAIVGAVVKAVVTIEIINRPDMVVTVKGPGGRYVSIPVADSTLITQLRIGEVTIITYAEALALVLEKVGGGK